MARICDLSADQLARHATNSFIFYGRQEVGTRLAYHALALNPHQPEALARLGDFLDVPGAEVFSAAVFEYACSPDCPLPDAERQRLDDLRFVARWTWGFSRHDTGSTDLAEDDFADRSRFTLDRVGWADFLAPVMTRAGSRRKAFQAAHTLAGVFAGLLTHAELGSDARFEEVFHPERFIRTDAYEEWLASSTDELDQMEEERTRQTAGGTR